MTGTIMKMAGAAALVAGLAFGSASPRAAAFAPAAPLDAIVANEGDTGSLLRQAWFGCGPYGCGWHPNYFRPRFFYGPRFGFWRPRPVVRCGPYHCWRRISEGGAERAFASA